MRTQTPELQRRCLCDGVSGKVSPPVSRAEQYSRLKELGNVWWCGFKVQNYLGGASGRRWAWKDGLTFKLYLLSQKRK